MSVNEIQVLAQRFADAFDKGGLAAHRNFSRLNRAPYCVHTSPVLADIYTHRLKSPALSYWSITEWKSAAASANFPLL